jgi:anthranilate phosphoribosyltransferase
MNAAAAFLVAGLDENLKAGTERAAGSIDAGHAREKLDSLIRYTQARAA